MRKLNDDKHKLGRVQTDRRTISKSKIREKQKELLWLEWFKSA